MPTGRTAKMPSYNPQLSMSSTPSTGARVVFPPRPAPPFLAQSDCLCLADRGWRCAFESDCPLLTSANRKKIATIFSRHAHSGKMAAAGGAATQPGRMDAEVSNQLSQLLLFGLLACVTWFVAVEQPKIGEVDSLVSSVRLLEKQNKALRNQLADLGKEIERVERASPAGLQASSMRVFQNEYEERISAIRGVVEDVQRQVGEQRRHHDTQREVDRDLVAQLSQHLKWLDKQVQNTREEVEAASRLERANAMLEGRMPPPSEAKRDRAGARAGGADEESVRAEVPLGGDGQKAGEGDQGTTKQAATGGLVELRDGDFDRLKSEGDSWVVMFYAPWCGHCTAAAPAFQQAALQAPVHFARLDAAAHPDVAQQEGVSGFPTIRLYSKGVLVRTHNGERTVRGLLDFARGESSKGGPPLSSDPP